MECFPGRISVGFLIPMPYLCFASAVICENDDFAEIFQMFEEIIPTSQNYHILH